MLLCHLDLPLISLVWSQRKIHSMLHKFLLLFFPFFLFSPKKRCFPSCLPPPSPPLLPVLQIPRLLPPPPLSSSSLIAINYINRGDYPQKFDSAVWKLGLFLCSDVKLPSTGKYHVKCIECHWTNDFGGTNPLAHHAETKHRDLPRVAEWIAAEKGYCGCKARAERRSWHQIDSGVCILCPIFGLCASLAGLCRKWRTMALMGFFDLWRKRKLDLPLLINCSSNGDLLLLLPLPSPRLLLISFFWMVIMLRLLKEKGFNSSWI